MHSCYGISDAQLLWNYPMHSCCGIIRCIARAIVMAFSQVSFFTHFETYIWFTRSWVLSYQKSEQLFRLQTSRMCRVGTPRAQSYWYQRRHPTRFARDTTHLIDPLPLRNQDRTRGLGIVWMPL